MNFFVLDTVGSDPQTLQSEFPEFDFDLRKDWWTTDNNNQCVHRSSLL
jgi:hypothetical protein